jgi:hypothetical protein
VDEVPEVLRAAASRTAAGQSARALSRSKYFPVTPSTSGELTFTTLGGFAWYPARGWSEGQVASSRLVIEL